MIALRNNSLTLLIGIWAFLSLPYAYTQGVGRSQEDIRKQIQLTDRLLEETVNNKERTLAELALLNRQVEFREELVLTLSQEISTHNAEIGELTLLIFNMEKDIERIKNNYAKAVRYTSRSFDTQSFWLSVLSAKSFTEAYYRAVYFRQFSRFRKKQIQMIRQTKTALFQKKSELETSIRTKKELLQVQQREADQLRHTHTKQENMFATLQKKEKAYRSSLDWQREQLSSIITRTSTGLDTFRDTEDDGLTAGFALQRGFLKWPINKNEGIIIQEFGETRDAFGHLVVSDGIHLRVSKGQPVASVFSGRVTGVQEVPMSGFMVIVEHGPYRTVYANLERSLVVVDEEVAGGQVLGTVRTDHRTNETVLQFLVYKKPYTFLNPESWLVGY